MKRHKTYSVGQFEVGLECLGEWKMDCPLGRIDIMSRDGSPILKAPTERFHVPYWNAQYCEPDGWNNPLITSEDGRYMVIYWLPDRGGLQSLLFDLERQGCFRFDSQRPPRRISFIPGDEVIDLRHHLTPYHTDLLLKDWDLDLSTPTPVFSGGFEAFRQIFNQEDKEAEQGGDGDAEEAV